MENEIVIGNLPADFYVPELCNEFRCFGNIISAWVRADENHGSSACVTFEEGPSALDAIRRMNKKRVQGRTIQVTTSFENMGFKRVFVKNFSPSWDESDLKNAFRAFGLIQKVQMFGSSGKSNGYGFVEFESHTFAKRAITVMNGTAIGGHKLIVERFKSKTERDNLELNCLEHVEKRLRESAQKDNLLVKNLPLDMLETELKRLFQKFGDVLSVKIMTDYKGKSKGFGFVSFEREDDAACALKKMNGRSVRGDKILSVHFKEDGELRERYKRLVEKNTSQYKTRSKSTSYLVPYAVERNMIRRNFRE